MSPTEITHEVRASRQASPDIAFAAMLVALVVLPLYPKIGLISFAGTYIPLRIDDLVMAAVGSLWVAQLFRERSLPRLPPIAVPAVAWLACGLIAVFIGAFVANTVSVTTSFLYWAKTVEYLVLGWIAFDRVTTFERLSIVTRVVFATAAIVIGYGVLQRFGWAPSPPTYVADATFGRVTSSFGDAHQLATYLGIVAIAAIMWVGFASRRWRVLLLLIVAAGGYVVVQTGARSEFVAALSAGLLLAVWPTQRLGPALPLPRVRRIAALLFGISLVIAFVLPSTVEEWVIARIGGPNTAPVVAQPNDPGTAEPVPGTTDVGERIGGDLSQDVSLGLRFEQKWPRLIAIGMRSPIFGAGPSAATEAADGYYVRSFVEIGVVGTIAFLVLMISVVRSLWKVGADATDQSARLLSVAVVVATGYVAVVGVLIDTWVASRPMQLFWPLVGAVLGSAAGSWQGIALRNRPTKLDLDRQGAVDPT